MRLLPSIWFAAAVALCGSAPASAATVDVDIANFSFSPQTKTINAGDQVRWTNRDSFTHTVTRTSRTDPFDSGNLGQDNSFTQTFAAPGNYEYHCSIHSSMTGTIVVRAPLDPRVQAGKDIIRKFVPVKLNLKGKDPSSVYLGSYIVNAQSACANCHSCPTYKPGSNPYNGEPKLFNTTSYLAGGVRVRGGGVEAVSANLTQVAANGRPAGLTRTAFVKLLRTGHDPDVPGELIPVMPWPIFGMMTDTDLNAVYDFLSAIPPAKTPGTLCAEPGQ